MKRLVDENKEDSMNNKIAMFLVVIEMYICQSDFPYSFPFSHTVVLTSIL